MSKERNPFSPGNPVAPGLFIGRDEQVKLLRRAIGQAAVGNSQYLFVTGERGIGKSSLACFGKDLAEREYGFVGAQALLGGADSLGEVCRRLYQSVISQMPDRNLLEKVRSVFERYVARVDLFGVGIEFRRDSESTASLAANFLPLLARIGEEIAKAGRKGIYLIADDLNGVAREAGFGLFLKSTVDQMAVTRMREFPWVLVLVGVPERMDDLRDQQPSVDRIFQPIWLEPMDAAIARRFYEGAFRSVEHTWDDAALEFMAGAVGGHPVLWHELGDAVFWCDQDSAVSMADATAGVIIAAESAGRKYLRKPLYDTIRGPIFRSILQFIAGQLRMHSGDEPFTLKRAEAQFRLPSVEAKNFGSFVQRMRRLGVLRPVAGRRGEYRFTSHLYEHYLFMKGLADFQETKRLFEGRPQ